MAATFKTLDGKDSDESTRKTSEGTDNQKDVEQGKSPFFKASQEIITALEGITSADKGQAVPFIKIWKVNPYTGKAAYPGPDGVTPVRPITMQMISPPRFGVSTDGYRREVPAASLDKVVVKIETNRGIIMYQQLNLSFMIHDPRALLTEPPDDVDDFFSLILPGTIHALEYGWSTSSHVKNPILNGEELISNGKLLVGNRKRVYFQVTNYSFKITPDNQIRIEMQAYEQGMLNLRKYAIGKVPNLTPPTEKLFRHSLPPELPKDYYQTKEGKELKSAIMKKLSNLYKEAGDPIPFSKLMNFFASDIENAFTESGYKNVFLAIGNFNNRCGTSAPKYGGQNLNSKWIGNFKIPKKDVAQAYEKAFKAGKEITVYNFLTLFISILNQPGTWTNKNVQKAKDSLPNQSIPQCQVKIVPGKESIALYILDVKREYSVFTSEERQKIKLGIGAKIEDIKKECQEKGVPFISFLKANSYLQDTNFSVEQDPKIKSLFIRRGLAKDAHKDIKKTDQESKSIEVDPRILLYSASITGHATMLGNFAFDMFGTVWLDFGVPRWSGTFFINGHEDTIERSGFNTKLTFTATGTDPLGSQGRNISPVKK